MTQSDSHWHTVASFSALADPGSLAFTLPLEGMALFGFVVRKDAALYAYENFCPHAGRQLNWGPDRFLTGDQSLIMCAAHGALFEIETGTCCAGPCVGDSLKSLPVRNCDGSVQIYQPPRRGETTQPGPGS